MFNVDLLIVFTVGFSFSNISRVENSYVDKRIRNDNRTKNNTHMHLNETIVDKKRMVSWESFVIEMNEENEEKKNNWKKSEVTKRKNGTRKVWCATWIQNNHWYSVKQNGSMCVIYEWRCTRRPRVCSSYGEWWSEIIEIEVIHRNGIAKETNFKQFLFAIRSQSGSNVWALKMKMKSTHTQKEFQ